MPRYLPPQKHPVHGAAPRLGVDQRPDERRVRALAAPRLGDAALEAARVQPQRARHQRPDGGDLGLPVVNAARGPQAVQRRQQLAGVRLALRLERPQRAELLLEARQRRVAEVGPRRGGALGAAGAAGGAAAVSFSCRFRRCRCIAAAVAAAVAAVVAVNVEQHAPRGRVPQRRREARVRAGERGARVLADVGRERAHLGGHRLEAPLAPRLCVCEVGGAGEKGERVCERSADERALSEARAKRRPSTHPLRLEVRELDAQELEAGGRQVRARRRHRRRRRRLCFWLRRRGFVLRAADAAAVAAATDGSPRLAHRRRQPPVLREPLGARRARGVGRRHGGGAPSSERAVRGLAAVTAADICRHQRRKRVISGAELGADRRRRAQRLLYVAAKARALRLGRGDGRLPRRARRGGRGLHGGALALRRQLDVRPRGAQERGATFDGTRVRLFMVGCCVQKTAEEMRETRVREKCAKRRRRQVALVEAQAAPFARRYGPPPLCSYLDRLFDVIVYSCVSWTLVGHTAADEREGFFVCKPAAGRSRPKVLIPSAARAAFYMMLCLF